MPAESKTAKATRKEVERWEGILERREDKVADAKLKLSTAKDRHKAATKKPKKTTATKSKAKKGKGTRKKKASKKE